MTSFQEFFTKLAPVTKRLQLDPYFKDQTTSLGVYFEPIKKKKFEKFFLVNAFANGLISVLLSNHEAKWNADISWKKRVFFSRVEQKKF